MHKVQVHHPDLVAQAAGHLSQDEYSGHLGIVPQDREVFQQLSNLWLQSYIDLLHQVLLNIQS